MPNQPASFVASIVLNVEGVERMPIVFNLEACNVESAVVEAAQLAIKHAAKCPYEYDRIDFSVYPVA